VAGAADTHVATAAFLAKLLPMTRLPAVVDIGANPVDGPAPYSGMLAAGRCTVVGFEPQPEALAALHAAAGPNETYLPDAIGDGAEHVLHVAAESGMTSLLEPDPDRLAMFPGFAQWGAVVGREPVRTRRLDDIESIAAMDLLKIDVQGAELLVFRNAPRLLSRAMAVHVEVSFMPLYRDQPSFGDVDTELRSHGLVPHSLEALKKWPLARAEADAQVAMPPRQLLEADVLYVRDPLTFAAAGDDELGALACIAHEVYASHELVYTCLRELERRSLASPGAAGRYLRSCAPPPA
jgi:FkbM family methyltransferase